MLKTEYAWNKMNLHRSIYTSSAAQNFTEQYRHDYKRTVNLSAFLQA